MVSAELEMFSAQKKYFISVIGFQEEQVNQLDALFCTVSVVMQKVNTSVETVF